MVPKMPLSASFQVSGTEDAMVSEWLWVAHWCAVEVEVEVNVLRACDMSTQRSMWVMSAHRSEVGGVGSVRGSEWW